MKKRIQRPQKSSWLGYSALTRATRVRVPVAKFCHCVCWGKHHRQLGSTLLDVIKVSAKGRDRFSLSFPAWHLPKVLILQSASARAGADRTFSDQYLGQVPGGQQMKKRERRPGTAASGLLIMLVANRTPRMVTQCMRTLIM